MGASTDGCTQHVVRAGAIFSAEPKLSLMQRIQRRSASKYPVPVSTVCMQDVESQLLCTPAARNAQRGEFNLADVGTTSTFSSEVEWPEGNATCESCGRVSYGCEVWGKSGVILCACCRRVKDPMLLAIAREFIKTTSTSVMDRS